MSQEKMRVGLLVTCLIDLFRPEAGFAAVALLEEAGCRVEVPRDQTCCGQPAYNSGDRADARRLAANMIALFSRYDAVVVPSASCAGMVRHHYPLLFDDDPDMAARARALAGRTWELTQFLAEVLKVEAVPGRFAGRVAWHDSCSALREMGVKEAPRRLLARVDGLDLAELAAPEECCGFGGTFCVKYPEISERMVADKVADIEATGAGTVAAVDLGCLLNIAGRLKRKGSAVEARHVAELLAGISAPPIGAPEEG